MKKNLILSISALAFVALMSACQGGSKSGTQSAQSTAPTKSSVTLAGAGATFPQPFYLTAFKKYTQATGVQVNYGGIGSGGGIKSLRDMVVDFGASDAFLSDNELKAMPAEVLHIPTCMGAVVLCYNLKNVPQLKLTGEVVANVFLGKITKWNDKAITALNPGVKLPDQKITPIHRTDGSGTTFIFSDYLTKVSPAWATKLGTGKALNWDDKIGLASKGNTGVAGSIASTDGSIGYVGSEYAFASKQPAALLQNSSGNFIEANGASISAAASTLPADNRAMVTNTPAANGYPISCFTWILIYKEQAYGNHTKEKSEATIALLKWMIGAEAQALTTSVNYAPLPASAIENSKKLLESVTYKGAAL